RLTLLMISCLLTLLTLATAQCQPPDDWKTQEAANLKHIQQLTTDFARAGESYFSPDMKHIIFQAEEKEKNPFYQMFVMDLGTKKYWKVSPGIGRTTCGYFHPNNGTIIFASGHTTKTFEKEAKEELERRAEDKRTGKHRRYQ